MKDPEKCNLSFGRKVANLIEEDAKTGITDMQQANAYLEQVYMPRHNAEFAVPAAEPAIPQWKT